MVEPAELDGIDDPDIVRGWDQIAIGMLLLSNRAGDLIEKIRPQDFSTAAHETIYAHLMGEPSVYDGGPVDQVAVLRSIIGERAVQAVGNPGVYLNDCVRRASLAVGDFGWHAANIRASADYRRSRALIQRAERAFAARNLDAVREAFEQGAQDLQAVDDDTLDKRMGEASERTISQNAQQEYIRLVARERAKDRRDRELAEKSKAEAANHARVKDGASFLLDQPDTPPAVWGKGDDVLWARGEALMICGPQGVGKTTLAGQVLAGTLGHLPEVLGYPVEPAQRRVLYLAMDRPQQAARNLGRVFRDAPREVLAERLRVWQGPPPADFAVAPETLAQMCAEHDADVVFIDSLKDAAVGLSKDEVGGGYNKARQLAIAAGVEVVELHHQRKAGEGGGKPTSISDVYGSTWITSGAGSILLLWGDPGASLVEFSHLKQPINTVGPFDIEHHAHSGLSSVVYDDKQDLVEMARRCSTTGLSAKDAAAAWFDELNPNKAQIATGRRKLQDLERKGLLVARETGGHGGRGKETLWFLAARQHDVEQQGYR